MTQTLLAMASDFGADVVHCCIPGAQQQWQVLNKYMVNRVQV